MQVYGKSLALIQDSADDSEFGPNGGFRAVLSTPAEDRDYEEVKRAEWIEPLPEHCTLDLDHGMTAADTIGSFRPYFDGEKMMMEAAFSSIPKAQEIRTLVKEGHLRSVSVAFMRHKDMKAANEPFRELLNAGIVGIPANRDAVILASKAASALKEAFSDSTEGEVPEDVKSAVLEALGVKNVESEEDHGVKDEAEGEPKKGAIYINVLPRFDEDLWQKAINDMVTKASATASGIGGDGALVQAIHDAASHLGAGCPVIEVTDESTGASSGANKSADEADTKDLEAFDKSLDEIVTPDESPAEAAAASDEEPAPADDAADSKATKRARELDLMQLAAQFIPTT